MPDRKSSSASAPARANGAPDDFDEPADLAEIHQSLERVAPSRLNVERPIDTLGLDSLMALELQHSIEAGLGAVVPMTWFLQDFSIAQLAAQLLAQLTMPVQPEAMLVASQEAVAEYPLSYGQRALWFLHQLAPESSAYNIPIAVRIRGELDIPALRRVFQKLVDRHPSLRTTFAATRGEPVQQVHPTGQIAFQEEQAAGWSPVPDWQLVIGGHVRRNGPDVGRSSIVCRNRGARSSRRGPLGGSGSGLFGCSRLGPRFWHELLLRLGLRQGPSSCRSVCASRMSRIAS